MRVDIALFASCLTVLGPSVGVGAVTRLAGQSPSAAAAQAAKAVPQDTWDQLLDSFVARDSRGKQRIDAAAQSPDGSPVRTLARLLPAGMAVAPFVGAQFVMRMTVEVESRQILPT